MGVPLLRRKLLGLRSPLWEHRIKSCIFRCNFITVQEMLPLPPGHFVAPSLVTLPRLLGVPPDFRITPVRVSPMWLENPRIRIA
jgi:hypothetical protein